MTVITSHQRRANDRRRFWAGYPAFAAEHRVRSDVLPFGFSAAEYEQYLRELYRAFRELP